MRRRGLTIPVALSTLFNIGSAIKTATEAIKTVDSVVETVDKFTGSSATTDEYVSRLMTGTLIKIREARFETERSLERLRRTKNHISSDTMARFIDQFSRVKPVEFKYTNYSGEEVIQQSEIESMLENIKISRDEARKFEAEGKQICSYLDAIKDRADQTNARLLSLENKLSNAVDEMEFVLERHGDDGSKLSDAAIEQMYHAFQIAKKINEIINTPLLSTNVKAP